MIYTVYPSNYAPTGDFLTSFSVRIAITRSIFALATGRNFSVFTFQQGRPDRNCQLQLSVILGILSIYLSIYLLKEIYIYIHIIMYIYISYADRERERVHFRKQFTSSCCGWCCQTIPIIPRARPAHPIPSPKTWLVSFYDSQVTLW